MTQFAIEDQPLIVPPQLAAEIGLNEALVLQQLHYWLEQSAQKQKKLGRIINGVRWIYNRLEDWLKQFPFLSEYALRKAIARLEGRNLIQRQQLDKTQWQRVMWYTINYETLKALQLSICRPSTLRSCDPQTFEVATVETSYTETTSETTSQTTAPTHPPAVVSVKASEPETEPEPTSVLLSLSCPDQSSLATQSTTGDDPSSAAPEAAIFQTIEALGIRLNGYLQRLVQQHPTQVVQEALAVLQERQATGRIRNPAGMLVEAIKGQWKVAQSEDPRVPKKAASGFSEWFELAKQVGLVDASMLSDGVQMVLSCTDGWVSWEEMLAAFPFSELQLLTDLR